MNIDILIAAFITTLFVIFILIIVQKRMDFDSNYYYGLVILAFPFSTIINSLKIPLLDFLFIVKASMNSLTVIDVILWLLIVGLTEEFIKSAPVIILLFKRVPLNSRNLAMIGWSLGAGFGIGEIWYLAYNVAIQPIELPGWVLLLSGFGMERFFVVFAHALFTMVALRGLKEKKFRYFAVTFLVAIGLHSLLNGPIFLPTLGILTIFEMQLILFLELIIVFVGAFYILLVFSRTTDLDSPSRLQEKEKLLQRARNV